MVSIAPRDDQLFPVLTPAQIARLAAHGQRRHVREGEVLVDPDRIEHSFFVVVEGELEVVRASRGADWGLAHVAALAAGAVLSRALIAFAYYPVVGDVSAARKYSHNVVMLMLALAMTLYAVRRARARVPES